MTSRTDLARVLTSRELMHDPQYQGAAYVGGQEAGKLLLAGQDRDSPEFRQFVAGMVSVGLYVLERQP